MIKSTFAIGPSQLSRDTQADIKKAVDEKILEISHRSAEFSAISEMTITETKRLLRIPEEYRVFYLDSANQAWHSIICNVVVKNSFHFSNGAFSGKFSMAATALYKEAVSDDVEWGQQNNFLETKIPDESELITVCYNETSTGVMMTAADLAGLRGQHPDKLIAVDTVSCAGAVELDFAQADLWYFSVQKCFGLPAGLGILVVSPRAYDRSLLLAESQENLAGLWSWERLEGRMSTKFQTPQTPNILNIWLLGHQAKRWNEQGGLPPLVAETKRKKRLFHDWVASQDRFSFLGTDPKYNSDTVFVLTASSELVTRVHAACAEHQIFVGGGYGKTKDHCFRIANFPAVSYEEMAQLIQVLSAIK